MIDRGVSAADYQAEDALYPTRERDQAPLLLDSATLASGGFVTLSRGGSGGTTLYATIFNSSGKQVGEPISITAVNEGSKAAIAALSGGGFTVAWDSGPATFIPSLDAQSFTAAGVAMSAAFTVPASTTSFAKIGAFDLAGTPDGNILFTWGSGDLVSRSNIVGLVRSATGQQMGESAFLIRADYLQPTGLQMLADGRALVTYTARSAQGDTRVGVGAYDVAGARIAEDFIAVTPTVGYRAITAEDDLTFLWQPAGELGRVRRQPVQFPRAIVRARRSLHRRQLLPAR